MNRLKKMLALFMSVIMILSLSVSGVWAADTDAQQTPETSEVTDQKEDESDIEADAVSSVKTGVKPDDGSSDQQPFVNGMGGSANFRIPSIVTLSDGTLLAAADARWDGTYDGHGLDTVVTRSTDGGKTWAYSFVNYFGDNGNSLNKNSTAFIDPSLATDGTNVYLLCDLFPAGTVSTNSATGTGMNENGDLLLTTGDGSSDASYDYYLKDGKIYRISDESADNDGEDLSGLSVDSHFNLTGTYNGTTYDTNLFFTDSPFKPLKTSYLYLVKSTDGGKNWSDPVLLNSAVKPEEDAFFGVAPGRGLVTSTGRILYVCYSAAYPGDACVIYSDDKGETWSRGDSMTSDASEAALAEANGRIYLFPRSNKSSKNTYFVSENNGSTWSSASEINGISYTTTCEISAITYSGKIDGKTAILLSAPTSGRSTGKIFLGLVRNDGSINWKYTYNVNKDGYYAYSCLTELSDGSLGLLYESAAGTITYAKIGIEEIAKDAALGTGEESSSLAEEETAAEAPLKAAAADTDTSGTQSITLYEGTSKTVTVEGANYAGEYSTGSPYVATVKVTGTDEVKGETTYSYKSHSKKSVKFSDLLTDYTTEWQKTKYYYKKDSTYYPVYAKKKKNKTKYYCSYLKENEYKDIEDDDDLDKKIDEVFYTREASTTPSTPASTTIVFSGLSAGVTTVVIGGTRYNITVEKAPDVIYADTVDNPVILSGTGKNMGSSLSKLNLSVGISYDLNPAESLGNGTWSVKDSNIATVDENGTVTGVSAGKTEVYFTTDGGQRYAIPVIIIATSDSTGSDNKIYDLYTKEVTNTQPYWAYQDGSTNNNTTGYGLYELQLGEEIYLSFTKTDGTGLYYFAKPDDGYALTQLKADGGRDYMSISGSDAANTDFITQKGAAGAHAVSYYGTTVIYSFVTQAINKGCDGGMGFTRPSSDTSNTQTAVYFRSEKLPTVAKEVTSVKHAGTEKKYSEGMTAEAGDVVKFTVTVTKYANHEDADQITYTDVTLTDKLSGAKFDSTDGNSTKSISIETENAAHTYTYDVYYTVKDSDLETTITNTVDLSYTYKANYSSGSHSSSAEAEASLTATKFPGIADIVVDFGLPVKTAVTDKWGTEENKTTVTSGTASYGTVTIDPNQNSSTTGLSVTYTPTSILRGIDTVTLTNDRGGTYSFHVYPATSVYYEEGFATYSGSWSGTDNKGKENQNAANLGSDGNVYGYDDAYQSTEGASNGTEAVSETNGDSASFTFTGTGTDIYIDNARDSGRLIITVKNSAGETKKLLLIQTKTADANGYTSNTSNYNVPAASVTGLEYDTYTVKVTHAGTEKISLDGFKVYNTLPSSKADVYQADEEDNPNFMEVRDLTFAGGTISKSESLNSDGKYTYTYTWKDSDGNDKSVTAESVTELKDQVWKSISNTDGSSVTALVTSTDKKNAITSSYITDGPKNEVYLRPGQSLTLSLKTTREVQLGMRGLTGKANVEIKVGNNDAETKSLSTTDLFYRILKKDTSRTSAVTVTITNPEKSEDSADSSWVSLTKLKVCDDADAVETLTENSVSEAVAGVLGEKIQADACLKIELRTLSNRKAGEVTLTYTGEEGEEHVFTGEEIEQAASALASEKRYRLSFFNEYEDIVVPCGESGSVTFYTSLFRYLF